MVSAAYGRNWTANADRVADRVLTQRNGLYNLVEHTAAGEMRSKMATLMKDVDNRLLQRPQKKWSGGHE
jgi:hypothetical protein